MNIKVLFFYSVSFPVLSGLKYFRNVVQNPPVFLALSKSCVVKKKEGKFGWYEKLRQNNLKGHLFHAHL